MESGEEPEEALEAAEAGREEGPGSWEAAELLDAVAGGGLGGLDEPGRWWWPRAVWEGAVPSELPEARGEGEGVRRGPPLGLGPPAPRRTRSVGGGWALRLAMPRHLT